MKKFGSPSRYLCALVLLLGLCHCVLAQGTSITPEMLEGDIRLQKHVTLLAPNTTLKDALAELQKQTGVALSVHRLSSAQALGAVPQNAFTNDLPASRIKMVYPVGGDTEICVLVRDKPLGDVLDSLYSLMSYQGARWTWNREKTVGRFAYELRPSLAMARVAENIRQQIQCEFEAQDKVLQTALKMSPDELKEAAKTNYNLRGLVGSDPSASPLQNRKREGLEAFFASLSAEQRLDVLRGKNLTVPLEALSSKGHDFVVHQGTQGGDQDLGPKAITFSRLNIGMIPGLFISTEGGIGGYNYIGTTWAADDWKNRVILLWHLKDDSPAPRDTIGARLTPPAKPVSFPKATDEAVSNYARRTLEHLLWRTGEAAPVSLVAVFPPLPPSNVQVSYAEAAFPQENALYGQSLAEALQKLHGVPPAYLDAKWRGDILLLRNAAAPFMPPAAW